jgi:hypothetical protein
MSTTSNKPAKKSLPKNSVHLGGKLREAPPEEQEFQKTYNLPHELLRVLLDSYYTRTEGMELGLMEWALSLSLDRYEDEEEG